MNQRIRHLKYLFIYRITLLTFRLPGKYLSRLRFKYLEQRRFQTSVLIETPIEIGFAVPPKLENSPKHSAFKIALIVNKQINRNRVLMEHELEFAYRRSLENLGISLHVFDTFKLSQLHDDGEFLAQQIVDLGISHLFLLGDYVLEEGSYLNRKKLNDLRQTLGIVICTIFNDCLISRDGFRILDFWQDVSDVSVSCQPHLLPYFESRNRKLCLWPSYPYPEDAFQSFLSIEKQNSLLVPGSSHRFRKHWADFASKSGISVDSQVSDNNNNSFNTYSLTDYFENLGKAKLIFTNGYRNFRESEVVARTTEIMLVKSLLLYQSGSQIDFFFKPYSHYVPVYDLPDLIDKVKYLLNNPTVADNIICSGRNYLTSQYSSAEFWRQVLHV
jgi:hypothetical protein